MATGVTVAAACKEIHEDIKRGKKYRYAIFHIKDGKQIDVEIKGERGEEYDDFLMNLQAGGAEECRYGLYDFEYQYQFQGTAKSYKKMKLLLINWCPHTASIKKKMVYASSFAYLRKVLVGVQEAIQATDLSEASVQVVEERLRSFDRA